MGECLANLSRGVPQGSILGPLFLNIIYINYLDSGLKSLLSKFVDVTKPGGKYIAEKGVIRFKKF